GFLVESAVGGEEAVALPGVGGAVVEGLAADAGDAAAGFGDEDVAGGGVPVVKLLVGVEIDVAFAARDEGELDSRRVRLADAGGAEGLGAARAGRRARAALDQGRLAQVGDSADATRLGRLSAVAAPAAAALAGAGETLGRRLEHDPGGELTVVHEGDHD